MTEDDPIQAERAQAIVSEEFHVPATVLIETDWVLRSFYGWSRVQRAAGFRILLDMPGAVSVPKLAAWAVERMAAGADFADMMHVAAAEGASSFATFDRKLARRAGPDSPVPIETVV
jgi:predicted nucleic-acid-binding protein